MVGGGNELGEGDCEGAGVGDDGGPAAVITGPGAVSTSALSILRHCQLGAIFMDPVVAEFTEEGIGSFPDLH